MVADNYNHPGGFIAYTRRFNAKRGETQRQGLHGSKGRGI